MLSELNIRNFAIIDDISLSFVPGFNVLTGETGAGKSIILDAVMLVLGDRADRTMVRDGFERATIEATFTLSQGLQARLNPRLVAESLEGDAPEYLVVEREVRSSGRSVARINGRTVNLALMHEIGDLLIDIHGQGSHLSLLQPKSHLALLDAYAGASAERDAVSAAVRELRRVQQETAALQRDEQQLAQRVDMLTYQVREIDAAMLEPDEETELLAERQRLANAEQLMRHAAAAVAHLIGVDDDTPSVLDLLNEAERALDALVHLDDSQAPLLESLQGLAFQLNEVGAGVADYQETLEFNPGRLDEVEERIELINRLKRKYGRDIAAILDYRDRAAGELDSITHSEERLRALSADIDRRLRHIGRLAAALSASRRRAAKELAAAVETELEQLRMSARFDVQFETKPAPNGAYVNDERLAFDHTGIDVVEFLISTNPGEPLKPMARVASGGETARLMLALKTALARVDDTPTLIFDEIDQGIGGRIGDVVGRKLWGLAAGGQHQVIVVTHLPQLAGFGDVHYHVTKEIVAGRTQTRVAELVDDARIGELAAMLGTSGQHARGGASAILTQAAQHKKQVMG